MGFFKRDFCILVSGGWERGGWGGVGDWLGRGWGRLGKGWGGLGFLHFKNPV